MRPFVIRRARQSWRKLPKDFLRLAYANDLLSRLGTLIMRASPKATFWTAGIMSSGYLSNRLGLPGFSGLEALVAPVAVGGGLLGLGMAIRFVPAVLSAKWVTVAEACDLNLMEDYRKSQIPAHLNALWDKVFFYESAIRYSPQERQAEQQEVRDLHDYIRRQISVWDRDVLTRLEVGGQADQDALAMAVLCERAIGHIQEKSREGFLVSSLYALHHALPQCSQAHTVGFRLNLYEDLCDGGYFDRGDTKLAQQYAGNSLLADVQKAAGLTWMDRIKQLPASLAARWWFFLVTRRIATGVGQAVQRLNSKYGTDVFNSQAFLWPGQETAPWLDAFPGSADDILTERRSIVRAALGNDYDSACATLDRMFLACFEFATDLRARYDPQYCDGSLDYIAQDTGETITNNLQADLKRHGYRLRSIEEAERYVQRVRREQADLLDRLAGIRPALLEDPLALRAIKIAFHINHNGMKDRFRTCGSDAGWASWAREIDAIAAERETYERRLVGLRLHHQLTVLLLDGYKELARMLAY